ncbi:hypothetical protein AGABI2DRAFT_181401 [Agaricus bisporus var. bisporus H97]|uniref:hypothetical protein n=1 Tax=Agaricus bisporus var. bisporus (strain H97 / ATCC MYA-4626 / FGSC 10389) TaxID=936046 RepID=UPI00029F7D4F|nr:hypothetical protein AGABI2DRAFT_181401 [Agaricus bisporus var. bisporus H97]EKV42159.1 hypothetical protein AGABI2DRAFT_181401 [Agaricus bisporus var. bisporus H97]
MDLLLDASNLHPVGLIKNGIKFGVGLYLDHKAKKTCERVLNAEFEKLVDQGYLSVSESDQSLVVTDKALDDLIGLTVYFDIRAFVEEYAFNEEEMGLLARTRVCIQMNKKLPAWDKRLGTAWAANTQVAQQFRQRASTALGMWYHPSGVGAKQSLNQATVYFMSAEAALDNSKAGGNAEGGDSSMAIVTRAIGLAQLCGIEEIGLVDIMEGLSMSFVFETIARHMVASVRGVHASQVYNVGLHINGSSENVATQFAVKAKNFIGPREVIGKWTATGAALDGIKVKVVARPEINMPKEGEEIWCMSGWAEALRMHTAKADEMAGTDVHGSQLLCDKKSVVKLSLKRVDGILMVKIKQVGILSVSDRYCGGITGLPCPCDSPDPRKRLAPNGKIGKLKLVYQSCDPVSLKAVKPRTISVLKTYNDAIVRTLACHVLTSSYLRAENECLHCAVSRAAGAGCNTVLM